MELSGMTLFPSVVSSWPDLSGKIAAFVLRRLIWLVCADSTPEKRPSKHFLILQAARIWRRCSSKASRLAMSHRL